MTSTAPDLVPGSTRAFAADPVAFLTDRHRRHGDVFAVRLHGVPTVVFGGASGPATLFRGERGHLDVHNTTLVHELFGQAVFNLHGDAHRQARRPLWAALTGTALSEQAAGMSALAARHVASWAQGPFDLHQAARALTMDACAGLLLGLPVGGPEHSGLPATFDVFVRAGDVAPGRRHVTTAYWRGRQAATDLRRTITARMSAAAAGPGPDVLSRLVTDGSADRLEPARVPDHLLALMIATRETTASLLTSMLLELAVRTDLTAAISEEHAAGRSANGPAGAALRGALLETERLHSPNMLSRRIVVTALPVADRVVPPGWHAAYSPAANHLLPDLFDAPARFYPDRFDGKHGRGRAAGLLTFGQGLHACPGKQLAEQLVTAVVGAVAVAYRLELLHGAPERYRYLPVKAPLTAVPVVLHPWRRP
jgi:cytochrome P450